MKDLERWELINKTIISYINEEIGLGRAAEIISIHREELKVILSELGITIREGPIDLAEAKEEVQIARKMRT